MKLIFYTLLLVFALSGCSHKPKITPFPETADAGQEILKLDGDMNAAVAEQVNVLSPNYFKRADDLLEQAKDAQGKGKESKIVLRKVAESRAYLDKSREVAGKAHANIHEVIAVRGRAIIAGAPTFYSKDFMKTDRKLVMLGGYLERDDVEAAVKRSSKIQNEYLELELKSIKKARLGKATEDVAKGIKENGKRYAPRSLALAEKKIKEADDFISANRESTYEISEKARDASEAAAHFLKITREAKKLKKQNAEEIALAIENEENVIAKKDSELQESRDEETRLANERMAQANMERSYENAQDIFSPEEAEVYKQGNKLVIRLRGLNFPVAKSDIKGKSIPLLHKVEEVIKDFGKSSVVVEGYTDSDGGKEINKKISEERAHVVRDYLISTEAVADSDITAIGLGDERPLATNKTAMGKAQNRRVDVIITPMKEEL